MKSQLYLIKVLVYLCHNLSMSGQISSQVLMDTSYIRSEYVEVFDEENIDFFSNGFIRSTTNILKFNVGDPEKFALPFYLLLGTTADVITKDRFVNEELVFDMLNANGGLINAGYKMSIPITNTESYTQVKLLHQLSMKSINGIIPESGEKKSFLSYMGNIGLMLNVKAWNPDDQNNNGQFWILSSASVSKNPADIISQFFTLSANEYFIAIHLESGITLSKGINIKGGYYRFVNNQHITGFDDGQFKLTGIYDL